MLGSPPQVDLENDLLRIMYESQVPLLENEELFLTLQTSQRTSQDVKEALITSQVTEKEIDTARAVSTILNELLVTFWAPRIIIDFLLYRK